MPSSTLLGAMWYRKVPPYVSLVRGQPTEC